MNLRERVRLWGLAFAVLCSGAGASAAAQDQPAHASKGTRVELEFSGADDCIDAALLEEELVRRAGDLVVHGVGEVDVRVTVRLSVRTDGYGAEVFLTRADGQETHRAISGGSCAEVVEGAALIIAVSLPSRPESAPPSAPAPLSPASLATETATPGLRFGGGIDAAVLGELAPSAMLGFEVFVDVASEETGLAPAFRLGLRHAARAGISAPPGEASFGLDAGVAEFCPVAARLATPVRLRMCALGVVGVLSATSTGLERSASDRHPWVAFGSASRVEFSLSSALSLEIAGSAEATVTPGRFLIDDEAIHRTPDLGLRAATGLVARFR